MKQVSDVQPTEFDFLHLGGRRPKLTNLAGRRQRALPAWDCGRLPARSIHFMGAADPLPFERRGALLQGEWPDYFRFSDRHSRERAMA